MWTVANDMMGPLMAWSSDPARVGGGSVTPEALSQAYGDGYTNGVVAGSISAFRALGGFSLWALLRWWWRFGKQYDRMTGERRATSRR